MFEGKKVRLRAIETEDLPLMVAWRNDPSASVYFYEWEPLSLDMQKGWVETLLQNKDEKLWIIETVRDRKPVGTIGLSHIDWRNRKVELSRVLVVSEERGTGVGREALCMMIRYVFDHLNMNRFYCDTFADNKRAVEFYEKLGFTKEAIYREHIYRNGRYADVAYFSMLASEYRGRGIQEMITGELGETNRTD